MRNAETVLGIIHDRGKRGLPIEDVYRQLFNPDLLLRAYGRIYRNDGAMTRGITKETVDGMSLGKIEKLIDALRHERFRWTPVRRTYIPKRNGNQRPLGIPTWSDKLLQEVMRSILEAYYEPQFSDLSHGFRSNRGCHTALRTIQRKWRGVNWFIEGDIKGCFDNIDHDLLLSIIQEKIHDNRFIRLLGNLLKAGYLEEWNYKPTLSGTPQGGVISPILSNIYLDRLDQFVESVLIPRYTRGKRRRENTKYGNLVKKLRNRRKKGDRVAVKEIRKMMRQIPSRDTSDPNFRRIYYVRYADDFLLGFSGPKREAEGIKDLLREFLQKELKLELSAEKTLITHAVTEAARFLGYEIMRSLGNTKRDRHGRRSINDGIHFRVPRDVVKERCNHYKKHGKIVSRANLVNDHDYTIVNIYQGQYRGFVQYYLLAHNLGILGQVRWTVETSLLRTLAKKHKTSVRRIARRYRSVIQTPDGPRRCFEVKVFREGKKPLIARFGGISLKRQEWAEITDRPNLIYAESKRTEVVQRLLAETCELCRSTQNVQVHHIRKLADLNVKGQREKPKWIKIMAARHRKTLVVCRDCHYTIHAGKNSIIPKNG